MPNSPLLALGLMACRLPLDTMDAGHDALCIIRRGDVECGRIDFDHRTGIGDNIGVVDGFDAVEVAVGLGQACARDALGEVRCWGGPELDLTTHQNDSPSGSFTAIAATNASSWGLRTDGTLQTWGNFGETWPELVPTEQARSFRAMERGVCFERPDGSLVLTGYGGYFDDFEPVTDWTSYDCDRHVLCWTDRVGSLSCTTDIDGWGVDQPPDGTGYHDVEVGSTHACAMNADDHVVCWGRSDSGELDVPAVQFRRFSTGGNYSCGEDRRGKIRCWGCSWEERATLRDKGSCEW